VFNEQSTKNEKRCKVKAQKIILLILSMVLIPVVTNAVAEEANRHTDSCCCKVGSNCDILLWQDCLDIGGTPYDHPPYNCVDYSRCEKATTALPSLSEWVLIALALSVGGFFVWQLKRKRKAVVGVQ
jgi:hypothetical protein